MLITTNSDSPLALLLRAYLCPVLSQTDLVEAYRQSWNEYNNQNWEDPLDYCRISYYHVCDDSIPTQEYDLLEVLILDGEPVSFTFVPFHSQS